MNKHVKLRKKHQRQAAWKLQQNKKNKENKALFKKFCMDLTTVALPKLIDPGLVTVYPIGPVNNINLKPEQKQEQEPKSATKTLLEKYRETLELATNYYTKADVDKKFDLGQLLEHTNRFLKGDKD